MANEENLKSYKPIGLNRKVGSHVFGVRLPEQEQTFLLSMDSKRRVIFIRTAIIDKINKILKEKQNEN